VAVVTTEQPKREITSDAHLCEVCKLGVPSTWMATLCRGCISEANASWWEVIFGREHERIIREFRDLGKGG
jgi:hypothetical protein